MGLLASGHAPGAAHLLQRFALLRRRPGVALPLRLILAVRGPLARPYRNLITRRRISQRVVLVVIRLVLPPVLLPVICLERIELLLKDVSAGLGVEEAYVRRRFADALYALDDLRHARAPPRRSICDGRGASPPPLRAAPSPLAPPWRRPRNKTTNNKTTLWPTLANPGLVS